MDEHEVNCSVCMEPFHEELHSPRTLRCGHTFCTPCIEALLQRSHQDRICPECRKPLKISAVAHIPVSYTILRLSRALSSANSDPHIRVQIEDGETCFAHGAPIISWCKPCNCWMCRECTCRKECTTSMELPEALLHVKRTYVDEAEKSLSLLTDKKAFFEKEKQEIKQEMLDLRQKNEKLDEALKKLDEGIITLEEYEAKAVEASSSRRLVSVLKKTNTFVTDMNTWLEDLVLELEPAPEAASAEEVSPTVPVIPTPPVPLSGPINFLLLKERLQITQSMFAVQEKDGKMRWSKLSIHGKSLLLHALDDTPPPAGASLVPFDRAVEGMKSNKPSAFFDVTIQQRLEGHVFMVMFGNTPRSQNFLLFCTGARGPCYKNLQLKAQTVDHDTKLFPLVTLGDFKESNVGKPLVAGITDGGDYTSPVYPGLINGVPALESSSMFEINLEHMVDVDELHAFGNITEGLAIMTSVYREIRGNRREAVISDCGIVIPLS